ncbi:bifunctional transcriptional activator/DNA repair enzyme AdaA [Paraferrimonas sp. SM1919]|uniref:bifunctional transcriptional activator/DNA repair enzyme AdaA n=1 Tax=Paraferrimonas sp. SM1919 TaxID=2662263 RepID=UPI0013CFCE6B|nr:methylated-DNA--[protein]-cysteine S-methyltransferase [Paraferrimonas sp. SM1919]
MHIQDKHKIHEYYQALVSKDSQFDGTFFVGVKTTSIFCIASCRARKPKFENVLFYSDFKSALDAGFRPCKICRPTENANQAPNPVQIALQLLSKQPEQKLSDWQLQQHGISPSMLRRWFNKHYGMTFQAYQRMLRVNAAILELKQGARTIDSALEAGYQSLSGFGYTVKQVTGQAPKAALKQNVIVISRYSSPIGPMFICASDNGICLLEFVDRRMLETEFADLQKRFKATIRYGENPHIKQAKSELTKYFAGERQFFEVALDTPGSAFQQQVWSALQGIEYGSTASYQDQANRIDNPKAVRAVANANGANKVAIMIPSHRVIGKDGSLTGYGGGLARKQWLLDHESKFS